MKIGVNTLPPEGEAFSFSMAGDRVRALWGDADAVAGLNLKRVDATARLTPFIGGVDLKGQVRVLASVQCVRCLADIELDLCQDDELRFERRRRGESPEVELSDAAFDVVEFDGETIDLAAWAAEQAALALPEHPRCDEWAGRACRLEVEVKAAAQMVDPRWANLQQLLDKKE